MKKIGEECGVFGIYSPNKQSIHHTIYYGLFALQHRGQQSCGIVVNNDGIFSGYKEMGIVNDVFTKDILDSIGEGTIGVGHVRYASEKTRVSTHGSRANCQPIEVNHIKGRMAIANNGSITNAKELREELELKGSIFTTTGNTELIAHVAINERINSSSIEEAMVKAMDKLEGAYSLVIMTSTKLVACRDKRGFRPLCYGKTLDGSYVIASESAALDAVGAKLIRDIRPGEIIVINSEGVQSIEKHVNTEKRTMCIFEYIYFARPDSVIEGASVHEARKNLGRFLAKEHPVDADIVIGAPDSGLDAAMGYAEESGIPYEHGILKNKYIGRTFIAPGQFNREDKVRIKLNPIRSVVDGKRLVLVDDSIVRGTTSKKVVKLLKDFGAKEVHLMISAPPFIAPCYYGTDIDSKENLIAVTHSFEEMRQEIGANSLGFVSIENVLKLVGENPGFCLGCFNEEYPTMVPEGPIRHKYDIPLTKQLSL
ncbi:MAG: amidophosphoribosyltransferase [Tissierellia bacterium]|nr:amidophosphoribosyltransferase [Tissierellia bacterium]